MIKVSKCSIKSEAAIQGCTRRKLFWRVLKISQKKPMHGPLLNKVARLHREFFLKKRLLCKYFHVCFAKCFLVKHVCVTASAKYPFVFHVNLNHKILPLILFFPFYFKYFQGKHFSFLKVLNNQLWQCRYNTMLIILILIL